MKKKMLQAWMIFIFFMPLIALSQNRQVTGIVKNQNGDPVPSASVFQKGTKNGTAADESGNFKINVTGNNPVLVISSVGFNSFELRIGNENSYNVVLQESGV